MLYVLVLAIHVLVSLFLILVVLLQSGKGGDVAAAFGGAGTQTVFGPRGTSNVLSKATTWSAAIFMLTSLSLVFLSQSTGRGGSVVNAPAANRPAPTKSAPAAPSAPAPSGPANPAPANPAPAK